MDYILNQPDGIEWNQPSVAFYQSHKYFPEPPNGLDREGRFERVQLLMKNGKPKYMFCAMVGGKYNTCSGVTLKIDW